MSKFDSDPAQIASHADHIVARHVLCGMPQWQDAWTRARGDHARIQALHCCHLRLALCLSDARSRWATFLSISNAPFPSPNSPIPALSLCPPWTGSRVHGRPPPITPCYTSSPTMVANSSRATRLSLALLHPFSAGATYGGNLFPLCLCRKGEKRDLGLE